MAPWNKTHLPCSVYSLLYPGALPAFLALGMAAEDGLSLGLGPWALGSEPMRLRAARVSRLAKAIVAMCTAGVRRSAAARSPEARLEAERPDAG